MNTEQFDQYKKCLVEIAKLQSLCGTTMLDEITDMLNDQQHKVACSMDANDVLMI